MRATVLSALKNDTGLQALGFTNDNQFYAGDIDTVEVRPLIVCRWGATTTNAPVPIASRFLVVWVYDKPNDYARIDAALIRVRAVLSSLEGVAHTFGWFLGSAWADDSEDLSDDAMNAIMRTSTFQFVASGQ